jgi:hypothetical protein
MKSGAGPLQLLYHEHLVDELLIRPTNNPSQSLLSEPDAVPTKLAGIQCRSRILSLTGF